MKLKIEEKDETQTYIPVAIQQLMEMVKVADKEVVIYVPNLCGGETKITIYESENPMGNEDNFVELKKIHKQNEDKFKVEDRYRFLFEALP